MSTAEAVPEYGALGSRLGAYVIDALINGVVFIAITAITHVAGLGGVAGLLGAPAVLAIVVAEAIWCGRAGKTPGKAIIGLRVVGADDFAPVGVGRALVRQLLLGLLSCLNVFQLFLIPRQVRRQGWHDMVARSVVVTAPWLAARSAPVLAAPPPAAAPPSLASGTGSSPTFAPIQAAPTDEAALTEDPRPAPPGPTMVPPPPGAIPSARASAGPVPPPPLPTAPPAAVPPAPVVEQAPPSPSPSPSPSSSHLAPPPPPLIDDDLDLTQVGRQASGGTAPGWRLRTVGGEFEVNSSVLLGRDPDRTLVEGAEVWSIEDPALSVSKTHALLTLEGDALYVEDWHSTNGTSLERAQVTKTIAPHTRTALASGDVVRLGDFVVSVSRGGAR